MQAVRSSVILGLRFIHSTVTLDELKNIVHCIGNFVDDIVLSGRSLKIHVDNVKVM